MHPDSYTIRYQPTSPLSPRLPGERGLLPPSTGRGRPGQPKQSPRSFRLDLSTYPGLSSRHPASPTSAMQSPAITLNRGTAPTPMESPRLMREKQKELIARAQLSSKLAASPLSAKPDAPRLDPLGSPKGPVTPLTLGEEADIDYFTAIASGRFSPAGSPGPRSSRSSTSSDGKGDKVMKKKHTFEMYR